MTARVIFTLCVAAYLGFTYIGEMKGWTMRDFVKIEEDDDER